MGEAPPKTIRQYVLATVRGEILRGEHPTGGRLRQEEIAKRLDVSTTPVREAFRDLLAEGLTLQDVQEIYEMRIRLEPLLAERSFERVGEDDIGRARTAHERMCRDIDAEQWAQLNEEFHRALTGGKGNGRLSGVVYGLAHAAAPYVVLSLFAHPEIKAVNTADHAELLCLYEARDKTGIVRVTREHLSKTLDAIEREVRRRAEDVSDTPLLRAR
jgi:DNA-binding GntR family transcriptional regulator